MKIYLLSDEPLAGKSIFKRLKVRSKCACEQYLRSSPQKQQLLHREQLVHQQHHAYQQHQYAQLHQQQQLHQLQMQRQPQQAHQRKKSALKIHLQTNPQVVYTLKKELYRSKTFFRSYFLWITRIILKNESITFGIKPDLVTSFPLCKVFLSTLVQKTPTMPESPHEGMKLLPHAEAAASSPHRHGCLSYASAWLMVLDGQCADQVVWISADARWSQMLMPLISRRVKFDFLISWLSTLGGAHSSLGDSSQLHSVKAGQISAKQACIAEMIDDPILRCRAKLYFAHSLMQRNRLKEAKALIKSQYPYARQVERQYNEPILVTCCEAAWIRLRYLRSIKRTRCTKKDS